MKLVIEVKEEDYKRYKEDKICSYANAVLDAVPLDEVLDEIKAEIDSHCSDNRDRNDGLYIAMKIIDKHTKGDSK